MLTVAAGRCGLRCPNADRGYQPSARQELHRPVGRNGYWNSCFAEESRATTPPVRVADVKAIQAPATVTAAPLMPSSLSLSLFPICFWQGAVACGSSPGAAGPARPCTNLQHFAVPARLQHARVAAPHVNIVHTVPRHGGGAVRHARASCKLRRRLAAHVCRAHTGAVRCRALPALDRRRSTAP